MAPLPLHPVLLLLLLLLLLSTSLAAPDEGFSTPELDLINFHDYFPPPPPPPPPAPSMPSLTCESDLGGIGSLDDACMLVTSLRLDRDVYIQGTGSLVLLSGVSLACPSPACSISVNVSGELSLAAGASVVTGSLSVQAANVTLGDRAVINVTALAGDPPPQTSGYPSGTDGAGGGHGGRGASCLKDQKKQQEDVWGGDAYSWSSLTQPWSYGSRGGTTSMEEELGGGGGGRISINVTDVLEVNGTVCADGGDGGLKGGGGSGGSIYLQALKMKGSGKISASGGNGFAGGGGGRVAIDVYSRHDDPEILVHGGQSYGCPENSGAAGTLFDAVPRSLIVSNHNMSTQTDTILLEFPNQPLWTNVYVKNQAKVVVPLLWSRVQVQGQLSLLCGGVLTFGLTHYPFSEFELMAEELLMSDSVIKVYGALRMSVKILLMWNSRMLIDGGGDSIVATSMLEASNLVVLKESSVIHSNSNLGIQGQGLLNLSGPGDLIEAQRLIFSLFYSILVNPGSVLRAPLENASKNDMTPRLYCDHQDCPMELLHPPEDCNVNSTLSFTLQICRVEDIDIRGTIEGSVVHFHRARSVVVNSSGLISASGLGVFVNPITLQSCRGGIGRGKILGDGLSGGGGHGGKGGDGYYNGDLVKGGLPYGNAQLPCELGSGSGNDSLGGSTAGGGIIVMGSLEHSLTILDLQGSLKADGASFGKELHTAVGGPGGGSGGTILLFLHTLTLGEHSVLSSVGGHGSRNGAGGGGGGRIHFDWADIPTGQEYIPIAKVEGNIRIMGGIGGDKGEDGENGTITGNDCPKGLYGVFCQECPSGTYKNVSGYARELCRPCPSNELPHRAVYINVRGGVPQTPCPYKCISDRYHMPHCYTALEELIHTFGGPWLFGLLLSGLLVLLALVLSVARMKFVGNDELPGPAPTQHGSQIDHSFPFLESLNEVLETNRAEESQSHVHRMYFMGPNTFSVPWHLPHSPPDQIKEIVYEDAFIRFVNEINALTSYQWWEGSVHSIVSILAYPLAWSWQHWRRRKKLQKLREFVRSEYDHSCLRSCRSRALYEGLKVAATPDSMLAYVDFFLGGDENRPDLPPRLQQKLPMTLIFGGDGSYMAPFLLHSDNVLTSLMSQAVPPTIWYRLVAGLNAHLRLVRRGHLRKTFIPVLKWLETHANPALSTHGISVDLAWFQATGCAYCQYGLVVCAVDQPGLVQIEDADELSRSDQDTSSYSMLSPSPSSHLRNDESLIMRKRISGGVLDTCSVRMLHETRDIFYPFSLILCNTKPVGHQDLVGLVISILLLADFSLVLLTLLLLYSISLVDVIFVLLVLPLGILWPFPAGINALFSHGPRRSAGLARVYALWNLTSLINVFVAFVCGFVHYKTQSSSRRHPNFQPLNLTMDDGGWWLLPTGLVLCKCVQVCLIDWHVANLEIQDRSLYSDDRSVFWQS